MNLEEIEKIHKEIEALKSKLSDEEERRHKLGIERAKKMERVCEIREELCTSSFPDGWSEARYFPHGAEYFKYCDDTMESLRWDKNKGWVEFEPEDFLK